MRKTAQLYIFLLTPLLLLSGLLAIPVSSAINDTHHKISSAGVIVYPSQPPSNSPEGIYGFVMDTRTPLAQSHFDQIKTWGFNTVLFTKWWGLIANEDGTLRSAWVDELTQHIRMARSAGLKVALSFRVQYTNPPSWECDGWASPPTHDYVNTNAEGRSRYCAFIEQMVTTFDFDYVCPWHFPYHMQDPDATRRQQYVSATFPAMLQAIRRHTNKPVIFSPVHQGITDLVGQADAGFYVTATPYNDANIVYGLNHMTNWQILTGQQTWDGNLAAIDVAFEGIRAFRQRNPSVQMCSVEFAPWEVAPLDTNLAGYFTEVLKRMQQYNVGWLYWRYEPSTSYPTQDIIDIMRAYV